MFTHYLQSIDSVAVYPIVSLLLFFAMFIAAVIAAVKADGEYIHEMEMLPLDRHAERREHV